MSATSRAGRTAVTRGTHARRHQPAYARRSAHSTLHRGSRRGRARIRLAVRPSVSRVPLCVCGIGDAALASPSTRVRARKQPAHPTPPPAEDVRMHSHRGAASWCAEPTVLAHLSLDWALCLHATRGLRPSVRVYAYAAMERGRRCDTNLHVLSGTWRRPSADVNRDF